ncbi:PIR Superfamily Protein [Plasmodium ovale wallikeri]|uniref:PIR Superfamily Protein n=1 Tax=Plasmodium ovale wallikeri TaxID=864142 RepID=A0A1A9A9C4_PLAOA|nr:PIR Superfamily Protein [Plasmodium ovale wallikeri]SBT55560.1 PIR Superfamily Protein [Plasmodium ovale wallikeri]
MDSNTLLLDSKYNYSRLDRDYKTEGDSTICNSLRDKLSGYIEVWDLCMKLTRALSRLKDLSFTGPFQDDPCKIVNYWMHNYLFNIILKGQDSKTTNTALLKIYSTWNEYTKKKKINDCSINAQLNTNDFNDMNDLFNYATDYGNVKMHLAANSYICTQDVKDYIKKGDDAYKKVNGKCQSNRIFYCSVLKDIEKANNGEALSPLHCDLQRVLGLTPELGATGFGDAAREMGKGSKGRDHGEATSFMRQSHQEHHSDAENEAQLNTPQSSSAAMAFTPFGSWINKHFLKKKIVEHNIYNDETNESLENTLEYVNENYDNNQHNIGYQSL